MKYLYGIIENCFNSFYAFRGYATPNDIIKYSEAYSGYQRVLNNPHTKEIARYFKDGINVFSPEIILAYSVEDWWDENINPTFCGEAWCGGGASPVDFLANKHHYSNRKRVSLKDNNGIAFTKMTAPKGSGLHMVRISLPDELSSPPFRRIDGNHRLEAMALIGKEKADYVIPVCIILLKADFFEGNTNVEVDTAIVEMNIFHKINAKAKPLTEIEQYRGFLKLTSAGDLRKFGEEFFITKEFLNNHSKLPLGNLSEYFKEKDDTVLYCAKFLIDRNINVTSDKLADVLTELNKTYFSEICELKQCANRFSLVPYVYYSFSEENPLVKIKAYTTWFINNKLYDLKDFDPASIIEVFNKIFEKRRKQIFVAMPFDDNLNFVFKAIFDTVSEINREEGLDLPEPVRIDKQITGFSYDIVEEILAQIESAGLLIADLTSQNANVYYEAGFAQGLIRAKLGNSVEILYLISNPDEPDMPFAEAKFDVNHYKIIPYKNNANALGQLEKNLKNELKAFYEI